MPSIRTGISHQRKTYAMTLNARGRDENRFKGSSNTVVVSAFTGFASVLVSFGDIRMGH